MSENETNRDVMLPTGSKLVLSSSPHLHGAENVRRIMYRVLLALVPAAAAGIWFFGVQALWVILATMIFCVGAEALWCKLAGKPVVGTISDCSAALTGLLLALNLPPGTPLWACLVGAFLAIWLGKQVFGGLGNNPFNPALVARVGLLIAIPGIMTTWLPATGMTERYPEAAEFFSPQALAALKGGEKLDTMTGAPPLDTITCATPLGVASTTKKVLGRTPEAEMNFSKIDNEALLWRYFWGQKGGCIGETSVIALLIGGLLLIAFNLINWRVPVCYIGTVAVITGVVHWFLPGVTPTPLFHILTGGLMLGAFFMATDMVTSPITGTGCVVFAIGCGVITSVIRIWGNYPEGVSFSILFMNALVPLIDRWCGRRPFGYEVKRG